MKKIVCFGDSNTWGYNPEDGSRYDEKTRWPRVMGSLLGEGFEIIEEGQNGRTIANEDPWEWGTKSGMDYVLPMMESHKPFDLLIIMLGSNDLKIKFGLPAADIAGSLRNMLMKIRGFARYRMGQPDLKILVVSPPLIRKEPEDFVFEPTFGKSAADRSRELAPYYKQAAEQFDCSFLDAGAYVEGSREDCLHLTPEGHALLARKMYEKVLEISGGKENR